MNDGEAATGSGVLALQTMLGMPSPVLTAFIDVPTQQLSSAYSALASELTRTEIRSLGGYSLGRVIGEGTFGKVRLGVHRLTNTRVAIKQVPKSLPSNASDPSSPLSLLTREIHHHRRLRHPHVLSLYELIATESSIYLVTELCAGGELFDYLVEKGRLSLAETRRIFGQLVLGMAYLHGEGVVHRDLKLENVLLDERVNVKIADLGFGREFEKGKWMDTWVGTLGYCAPEVVSGKKYRGEEVDIWSLGVILYALLTGSLPFDDDDEGIMREMILKCEYDLPAWLDEDAADLVRSILVLDPLCRASLKQILSHSFFTRPSPALTRRPTLSRTHSHSSSLSSHHHFPSQQLHEVYPPAILEQEEGSSTHSPQYDRPTFVSEASEPDQGAGPSQSRGGSELAPSASTTAAESDVSDSSYFSHGQRSQGKSGATSPITSAEEDEQGGGGETISAVKAGKRKAVEQSDALDEPENLLRRNESQATLCRDVEEADSTLRRRSALPVSFEEPLALSSSGHLSAPPSPTPASRTSVEAPGLQRNFSGGSSVRSIPIHGSPTPHARTPARTKRRSVGSIISERLISLDEEPSTASPSSAFLPPVDYLALMTAPRPSPLESSGEKDLLDQLTTLGFDTGQIVHSVTTNACDSSAATWWMLKRKMDERERAKLEDDAAAAASAGGGGLSRASSLSVSSRRREPGAGEAEKPELVPLSPQEEEPGESRVHTPPPLSASAPRAEPPTSATAHERPGYFVPQQPTASMSAPLLAYFPTVDPASPTRKKVPRSKSKDQLPSSPTLGATSLFAVPQEWANPFGAPASLDTSKDGSDARNRRARASSVSMLQRATSAIGSSLSLMKSGEAKEEGGEEGSGMTHSTSISAGLFRRKSSIPKEEDGTPKAPSLLTTPSAPSSPHRSLDAPAPATPPRSTSALPAASPLPSPAPSNSPSHDTFDTITSSTSSGHPRPWSSNTPPVGTKKGTKGGNLLANLKFWFGEGPRRRNKRSSPSRANDALSSASASLGRSQSLNSSYRGSNQTYVASPLRRPAAGSRRSSNTSIAPLSRRSSVSSAHRVSLHDHSHGSSFASPRPGLGLHHRHPSDSSRTSVSDRGEHSRPPSVRSFSGVQGDRPPPRRNRHSKAGSASSAGSYHPSVSPKDAVYRRPPTTTTVRRRHPSHSHGRHRRSASGASSVHTHRSSTSSAGGGGSDDDDGFDDGGGADPIMEEDETAHEDDKVAAEGPIDEQVKAAARERALRTLSGDSPPSSLSASISVSRPPLIHKASSSHASAHSESSSTFRHGGGGSGHATFSAHKATHLFGSPLQPRSRSGSSSGSSAKRTTVAPVVAARPPLRDVFASTSKSRDGESDWVDEDELEGYGGGLGQAGLRAQNGKGGEAAGGGRDGTWSYPGFLGAVSSPTLGGAKGDSPIANKTFAGGAGGGGGGVSMFEGRYAGMGGGGGGGARGSAIRTVVIEEEEEED
ncbi:hypothetical protein JCM21900_002829 [Sporobolomyces salmonicolor]